MRIAAVQVLLAAVTLAAVLLASSQSEVRSSYQRNTREVYGDTFSQEDGSSMPKYARSFASLDGWLPRRDSDRLLRREGGEEGREVQCCPSIEEMVEPVGGTNQDGLHVTLYRDGKNKQRFYELACRTGVEGRPCRFMDKYYHNISRCVQMYSYTYAIVHEEEKHRHHHYRGGGGNFPTFTNKSNSDWSLDYIKVRSGCSCVLDSKRVDKLAKKGPKSRLRGGGAKMKLSKKYTSRQGTDDELTDT